MPFFICSSASLAPKAIPPAPQNNSPKLNIFILINKKTILNNQVQTIALGTTLNFYENDYLFTPKGNLFTHKTESEINLFEQNFNFSLSSIKGNRHQIPEKQIIIHSPDLSGFILIQAFEGNFLWVDNESQLIEIYYPIQEPKKQYNNQFNIKIISTLENL
jgi:hypothetical protein